MGAGRKVLLRADSAFYGYATIVSALKAGTCVSITARMDKAVKRAIAAISPDAWTTVKYTRAILDDDTQNWIPVTEVAEIE